MVDMLVKMDQIMNAIKSTVPESMWGQIVRKLDADGESQSGGRSRHTFEPDVGCYDAGDFDVAGPRELVHGERESFIGGDGWQRSRPEVARCDDRRSSITR
jgi:hypothetical protein